MNKFSKLFTCSALALSISTSALYSTSVFAADKKPAEQSEREKKRKTNILSERIGKKVQKAYELYTQDLTKEALDALLAIEPSKPYDKAFVEKMIGNLIAADDKRGKEAITYLEKAVAPDVLNYTEQEQTMKLLADLNMQEQQYAKAIEGYKKWMDFTGKEDAMTYLKIANANYELKRLDKVVDPANKSIKLQKKLKADPYILKMASFYERKMYKEATAVNETLVKLFPEDKRWWVQLGMFYMLLEDYGKALSAMELSYKQGYLEKENQYKTLAQLYSSNGMPYRSAKLLEKYVKQGVITRNKQNLSAIGNSFLASQDFEVAANYFNEAAKIDDDAELYRKSGALMLQAEKYAAAVKLLKKALDAGIKKAGRTNMSLAQAYFYQRKYKQAYAAILESAKDPKTAKSARSWKFYIKDSAERNGVKI